MQTWLLEAYTQMLSNREASFFFFLIPLCGRPWETSDFTCLLQSSQWAPLLPVSEKHTGLAQDPTIGDLGVGGFRNEEHRLDQNRWMLWILSFLSHLAGRHLLLFFLIYYLTNSARTSYNEIWPIFTPTSPSDSSQIHPPLSISPNLWPLLFFKITHWVHFVLSTHSGVVQQDSDSSLYNTSLWLSGSTLTTNGPGACPHTLWI